MLTLIPDPSKSSMAGIPSGVAGTLISRLGRLTAAQRRRASTKVPAVSWARRGETSRLTKPSLPSVRSKTERRTSAARVTSSTARRSYSSAAERAGSRASSALSASS